VQKWVSYVFRFQSYHLNFTSGLIGSTMLVLRYTVDQIAPLPVQPVKHIQTIVHTIIWSLIVAVTI
jgi:hypothetical protein